MEREKASAKARTAVEVSERPTTSDKPATDKVAAPPQEDARRKPRPPLPEHPREVEARPVEVQVQ